MTGMPVNPRFTLVTGAGSGIGRASALALDAAGYAVALAGRRAAELEKTAAMAESGAAMLPVAADVSKPEAVTALFARVKQEFGRLDVRPWFYASPPKAHGLWEVPPRQLRDYCCFYPGTVEML